MDELFAEVGPLSTIFDFQTDDCSMIQPTIQPMIQPTIDSFMIFADEQMLLSREANSSLAMLPPSDDSVTLDVAIPEVAVKKEVGAIKKSRRKMTATEKEVKVQDRIVRNRLAAQDSRDRKKEYVLNLESTNNTLQDQNTELLHIVQKVDAEKSNLLQLVRQMRNELDKLKRRVVYHHPPSPDSEVVSLASLSPRSDSFDELFTLSPSSVASPPKGALRNTIATSYRNPPYTLSASSTSSFKTINTNSVSFDSNRSIWNPLASDTNKQSNLHKTVSSILNNDATIPTLIGGLSFLALGPALCNYNQNTVFKTETSSSGFTRTLTRSIAELKPKSRVEGHRMPFVNVMAGLRRGRQAAGMGRLVFSLGKKFVKRGGL